LGEVYGTHGREKEIHTGLGRGNTWERDHLDNTEGDGKIILKWILKKMMEGRGLD
jgi:hypothetical protein